MTRPTVVVLDDAAAVAAAVAQRVIDSVRTSTGPYSLALSGGSTPKAAYALLSGPLANEVDWSRVGVYFGDERCYPPEHPDSNFRMATTTLLVPLGVAGHSPRLVARIEGELDPDAAAQSYAGTLLALPTRGGAPSLDLVLLGMGPDGHTASLFPGASILRASGTVAATAEPHLGVRRVSLTYAAINAAREIVVLVTGADKTAALQLALDGEPGAVPLRDVRPTNGSMTILCDRAVAQGLALPSQ